MLVSGFINGRLIYILEFPFSFNDFVKKLEKQLNRRFPSGDKTGQYLRSANFYYNDFINCKNLKVIFLLKKSKLKDYKNYVIKNFYQFLEKKTEL